MCQSFDDLEDVEAEVNDILVWEARRGAEEDIAKMWRNRWPSARKKCEFGVKEVTYIGHRLTPKGVKADEQKVKQMPPPEDRKGAERLLGTVHCKLPS